MKYLAVHPATPWDQHVIAGKIRDVVEWIEEDPLNNEPFEEGGYLRLRKPIVVRKDGTFLKPEAKRWLVYWQTPEGQFRHMTCRSWAAAFRYATRTVPKLHAKLVREARQNHPTLLWSGYESKAVREGWQGEGRAD